MQSLLDFVRATVTSPRGLPDGSRALEDRVRDLDDRMETLDVLTWVLVPAALIVGADSFRHLVRAQPGASTSRLLVRSTICTWSLTAIAMTKLWHARAQEHTALMKEQLALRDQVDRSMLRLP